MNCTHARESLPLFVYGDLLAAEADQLQEHLNSCPACRQQHEALDRTRKSLNRAKVAEPPLDVGLLYRRLAERQERRASIWRRATWLVVSAAAAVLLALAGFRFEIRADSDQLTIRWGEGSPLTALAKPAPGRALPDVVVPSRPAADGDLRKQIEVVGELVQGLTDDARARERRHEEELLALRNQMLDLERQTIERWAAAERDIAALCGTQLTQYQKGTMP
jgi:anti-sigma factor RsiW